MTCRLCGGELSPLFQKTQLEKYAVHYYECCSCGCAQTEEPYWIEEAYHNASYALDTGMVARTLFLGRLTLALACILRFDAKALCLDIGGGSGLLTRYLRDYGLNAHWSDKYAINVFAVGFEEATDSPKLMTAFEVFEHLTKPREEISALLAKKPELLLFSTKLYARQQSDWWYFLDNGQHVQFYSKQGLAQFAQTAGYHFQTDGSSYHLFSKAALPPKMLKKALKLIPKAEELATKRWESRIEEDHSAVKRGKTSAPMAQPIPSQNALL